jgi:RNA methyltransferase, TrmH family
MSPTISSLTNPRVKAAVRLRDRRERDATGLTIVDGAREILRALDAGVAIETAFVANDLIRTPDAEAVDDLLVDHEARVDVEPAVLGKVAFGDRSDGIVAIIRTGHRDLGSLRLGSEPLLLVLEGLEKPGNLGAVLRTADAVGVDAVIAADARTDIWNPNAIRASLGTIFRVPVIEATAADTRTWLDEHGIRPVAAVVDATATYLDPDYRRPVAIILGSEATGLSVAWRGAGVEAISIPMRGIADSLNVSIAAAVVLFEAVRQRTVTTTRGD